MITTIKELRKSRYDLKINDVDLFLRYDLKALLFLEEKNVDIYALKGIEAYKICKLLLIAGLQDYVDNADNIISAAEIADRLLKIYEPLTIMLHIKSAIQQSMPAVAVNATKTTNAGKTDWGRLRCLYCDIMHRPDSELWNSTVREIIERWETYAVIKGYKAEPVVYKQYDED